jgi:hypothetical protein
MGRKNGHTTSSAAGSCSVVGGRYSEMIMGAVRDGAASSSSVGFGANEVLGIELSRDSLPCFYVQWKQKN